MEVNSEKQPSSDSTNISKESYTFYGNFLVQRYMQDKTFMKMQLSMKLVTEKQTDRCQWETWNCVNKQ